MSFALNWASVNASEPNWWRGGSGLKKRSSLIKIEISSDELGQCVQETNRYSRALGLTSSSLKRQGRCCGGSPPIWRTRKGSDRPSRPCNDEFNCSFWTNGLPLCRSSSPGPEVFRPRSEGPKKACQRFVNFWLTIQRQHKYKYLRSEYPSPYLWYYDQAYGVH